MRQVGFDLETVIVKIQPAFNALDYQVSKVLIIGTNENRSTGQITKVARSLFLSAFFDSACVLVDCKPISYY